MSNTHRKKKVLVTTNCALLHFQIHTIVHSIIHTYIHAHIHTYMHTYIHTHGFFLVFLVCLLIFRLFISLLLLLFSLFLGGGGDSDIMNNSIASEFSTHLLRAYFSVISIKQCQERCLSSSGSLHTSELELLTSTLQIPQIHQQVIRPHTCPLAHCSQLCRSIEPHPWTHTTHNYATMYRNHVVFKLCY